MKYVLKFSALLLVLISIVNVAMAQKIRGLDLGVSVRTGENVYLRKYYGQSKLPPGKITKIKSNYLWGAGIWAEKYMTRHFSTMVELGYTQMDVPTNTLCDCNYRGAIWLQEEKHHWGSLATGLRYYFNPNATVNFFADARIKADWFIASTIKNDDVKNTSWDSFGYSRFVPALEISVGMKWKRLSLNFEYDTNIARTFIRDAGAYDQVIHPFKTGIWGQGIFMKATYTAFKIR